MNSKKGMEKSILNKFILYRHISPSGKIYILARLIMSIKDGIQVIIKDVRYFITQFLSMDGIISSMKYYLRILLRRR